MKKLLLFLLVIISTAEGALANLITANPSNYTSFVSSLVAGDTLYLTAGTYISGLTLNTLNGTFSQPIVIMGSSSLYTTKFQAQSCCNTISITKCSFIVIKNLELDGLNLPVDAVKAEGSTGNWTHDITLEYLNIVNHGNFVQIVGINTKCSSWNWVIRKNRIVGAGTGIYLGGSSGDRPFVNGIIEYNYIANTLGYNMQIKHQTDTVRDDFPGTMINAKTIIRHNVFCKELNGETGPNARPNLLVGGFPLNGWGATDYYEIYGNFFYKNPDEALFQATGNVRFYENILVNHANPSGFPAVAFQPHNGVSPQSVKIYHNTVWVLNSTAGIRLSSPNGNYQQYCYANAVFAPSPLVGFSANNVDNITDSYANAGNYVLSATTALNTLDLYPQSGQLTGPLTSNTAFQNDTYWDKDFNGDPYNWIYRGAYSSCCTNNGWQLQLDTMPTHSSNPNFIFENFADDFDVTVFPNPSKNIFTVIAGRTQQVHIEVENIVGEKVLVSNDLQIDLHSQPPGIYFLKVRSEKGPDGYREVAKKIIKE